MKSKYIICLALIALLFAGCGWFDTGIPSNQKEKEKSVQAADESLSDLVDSDWEIVIDDTITHTANEATYIDTLKLNATKEFGTDGLGTYNGTIYLKVDHQLPGDVSGYNYAEHPAQPITFTLVPYDDKEYKAYEIKYKQKLEAAPLAPLTEKLDSMCLVNVILNGQWKASISNEAGVLNKDQPISADLKIRIGVTGSTVLADIIFADHSTAGFQGKLTKHPLNKN